MVTAVDSSVIFDLLTGDAAYGPRSRRALELCSMQGQLLACELVWAEVAAHFSTGAAARQMFTELGIELSPLRLEAALEAGRAWKSYRQRGGPRSRVAPDFLIGAHALLEADRLLTRDHGFYRSCFQRLKIMVPAVAGSTP